MLLVDSLYINDSGGLHLLIYLVDTLVRKNISFFLLADVRCKGLFDRCDNLLYLKATLRNRNKFYIEHKNSFSKVLCFGNIPAPVKLHVPVYTYYHNINYLTLKGLASTKDTFLSWLKRCIYKLYKNNTDYWVVQTDNTKRELICHLNEREDRLLLMPFYEIPDSILELEGEKHGDDYVYIATYTGSKQHEELLQAWCLLHEMGMNKTLHFTVPETARAFIKRIDEAQRRGVKVINHGFVPFKDVVKLYHKSKAIVYPSLNESLGLGIVEAINAGCDVLGSDLPFIHSICKPSQVFNPYSAQSIADAVMEYEKGHSCKSELFIHNQIEDIITLISD